MTKAFETTTAALADLFAEMDEKVYAESREWGLRRNQHAYYERLFNIAGGKTWYNLLDGRSDAMVCEVMDKNTASTIKSRNASIASKLEKAGISEIVSTELSRTSDGFNGRFVVNTDKGRKVVTIETIYAGGYNIQCPHLRVLVRVK